MMSDWRKAVKRCPQGSNFGPLMWNIFQNDLMLNIQTGEISHHLPSIHCYADDKQMILAFKPVDTAAQDTAVSAIEACLRDIKQWMIKDKLMINNEKTEFMMIATKAQLSKVHQTSLNVGGSVIIPNDEPIRNLGVWLDTTFSMCSSVTRTCKSAFYHLHNIRCIRKYLHQESTEG